MRRKKENKKKEKKKATRRSSKKKREKKKINKRKNRKKQEGLADAELLNSSQFGVGIFPLPFFILIFNNLRYFLTVNPLSEIPPTPSFFLLY